jgi:hypothetical protein
LVLPPYYLLSLLAPFACPCLDTPSRVPLLTASIHRRHVSFRDCSQRRWRSGRSRRQMLARKMDTPLSWNMLLGRELLEWQLPDLSESRLKAGCVKSCFLLHLLPPWWLWSPGTPLPSSPSISVAFTIRHSSLIWKVVAVFLIPYEISGYKY